MRMPIHNCHPPSTAERLDEVLEVACRLAGRDAIGSMHLAIDERPTYDQLLHYRRMAEAFGLSLTLEADSLVLRPLSRPEPARATSVPGHAPQLEGRWPGVRRWLQTQVAALIASL